MNERKSLHSRIEDPLLIDLSHLSFKRILDVGCGFGRVTNYSKILWPNSTVISLDLSRESCLYTKSRYGVEVILADSLKLKTMLEYYLNPSRPGYFSVDVLIKKLV